MTDVIGRHTHSFVADRHGRILLVSLDGYIHLQYRFGMQMLLFVHGFNAIEDDIYQGLLYPISIYENRRMFT
ncbi:hypothetical protein SDC9_170674 [bioreactor metagenome]|uniref:Uncharacterized protein n=1 Tax=bioreactor metagenome TaxID=1076179 RepID=A0A645GAY6_9ZZZZ